MTQHDQYPANLEHIEQGLQVLKRRKLYLMSSATLITAIGLVSLVTAFFQQDIIFHWFGLSQHVDYLHVPYLIDAQFRDYIHQPNYFMNALSWLGWLGLKIIVSFIGAFFIVGILKKFRFFMVRFQSFVLKFVAWLLAFILLWSGLSVVQYSSRDDEEGAVSSFIQYDQSIQRSEIYQYLQESNARPAVQDYLLAQVALLHKPADASVATAYTEKLVQAEKNDPHFLEYGFKPEQLWTLQTQVFHRAVTPLAQSVDVKVARAQFWSNIAEKMLWIFATIGLVIGAIVYLLGQRIAKRLERIGTSLR